MRRIRARALFCLLALLATASAPATAALLIRDVTVVDADGARPHRDVLVEGERIVAVSDAGATPVPAGTAEVDGRGRWLIPGLWDAHVHVTFFPEVPPETFFRLAVAHGITALRDTGGQLDALAPARAAAGRGTAPDLFVSGPLLDGAPRVYAGQDRFHPDIAVALTSPGEAAMRVDALAAAGVDFVKAYELLRPEVYEAVIAAADRHDLPVSAHAPLSMTADAAARAGADDFQHLRNLELACARDAPALLAERRARLADVAASGAALRASIHDAQRYAAVATQDPARCATLMAALAAGPTMQTPTLTMFDFGSTDALFTDARWRETFDLLDPAAAERWAGDARSYLSARSTSAERDGYREWGFGMIRPLADAGVPIMAGTDSPIGYLTPGASLHAELGFLAAAGLTPLEVLTAATLTPARFLGIDDARGRVAPGQRADLVLLRADPLVDVDNLEQIQAVVLRGTLLDATTLTALRRPASGAELQ